MLKPIRTTLNEIMAMAVLDLFPGTVLGEGRVTATQFSYQFQFVQPKHPELLCLIEEKMRAILKAKPLIEGIEMAARSAESYFEHHEQPYKADLVAEREESVLSLIRIGTFYDLMTGTPCFDLPDLVFKLLETKEGEWIEIVGTAFTSKEELKAFIKQRKLWLKSKPWEEAERRELLKEVEGSFVLLPKGMEKLHYLEHVWRSQIQKHGLREVFTGKRTLLALLAKQIGQGIAEWGMGEDLCIAPGKSCISSLHFINETFNMLELKAKWVVNSGGVYTKQGAREVNGLIKALEECGFPYSIDSDRSRTDRPSVELRISDSLGEEWPGPFLSFKGDSSHIYSLFGPIVRLIALLAELNVSLKGESEIA